MCFPPTLPLFNGYSVMYPGTYYLTLILTMGNSFHTSSGVALSHRWGKPTS